MIRTYVHSNIFEKLFGSRDLTSLGSQKSIFLLERSLLTPKVLIGFFEHLKSIHFALVVKCDLFTWSHNPCRGDLVRRIKIGPDHLTCDVCVPDSCLGFAQTRNCRRSGCSGGFVSGRSEYPRLQNCPQLQVVFEAVEVAPSHPSNVSASEDPEVKSVRSQA